MPALVKSPPVPPTIGGSLSDHGHGYDNHDDDHNDDDDDDDGDDDGAMMGDEMMTKENKKKKKRGPQRKDSSQSLQRARKRRGSGADDALSSADASSGAGNNNNPSPTPAPAPVASSRFGDLSRFDAPPKHSASSFMQFSRWFRAGKERGKAPNAKVVSETWNAMTEEERQPFVTLAEEDKKRVAREVEEYMAKYAADVRDMNDYKALCNLLKERDKREKDGRALGRRSSSPGNNNSEQNE